MKFKLLFSYSLIPYLCHAVTFQGIEESGVLKNTFLCPAAVENASDCMPADQGALGFDLSNGKILQLFNNQTYWLLQESVQQLYANQVLRYSGSDLENKMKSQGWVAMGGYCLVITSNPILTQVVSPALIAGTNQEKVVVQLWYNGDQVVQLWSQDATVLSAGQNFKVLISTNPDSLFSVASNVNSSSQSLKSSFLAQLGLQVNNRNVDDYNQAVKSPRSVKIQTV